MDPFLSQLTIVDSLASSPAHAAKVKDMVWGKVVALATQLAEAADRHSKDVQNASSYIKIEKKRKAPRDEDSAQQPSQGEGGTEDAAESVGGDGSGEGDEGGGRDGHTPNSPRALRTAPCSDIDSSDSPGTKRRKMTHKPSVNGVGGGEGGGPTSVAAADANCNTPNIPPAAECQDSSEDVIFILESGLFGATPDVAQCNDTKWMHRERAEAELESFKALGSKRTFGNPPLESLLPFWASPEGSGRWGSIECFFPSCGAACAVSSSVYAADGQGVCSAVVSVLLHLGV